MSKKIDRAIHGPSWTEVILGALLSLILGVVLGALVMVLRPVVQQKEMPKEPVAGVVYYIEGSKDPGRARQAAAKRQAFVGGQSVTVNEDEINTLVAPASAPPGQAPKAGDKKAPEKGKAGEKDQPAADSSATFATGTPNFRIAEGQVQVGVPITINLLGLGHRVVAQARGGFAKQDGVFVYEPDVLYVGSCPVQRLPFVSTFVRDRFLSAQAIPEDIKAAWMKLGSVSVEGRNLKLTMP